jgi:hypothetical protein
LPAWRCRDDGGLLNLIPIQYRVGAAAGGVLLALAGLGGAYAWIDHRGYERATQEWTVKYQQREDERNRQRLAELDRQATANAAAKAEEEAELEAYRKQVIVMADRNMLPWLGSAAASSASCASRSTPMPSFATTGGSIDARHGHLHAGAPHRLLHQPEAGDYASAGTQHHAAVADRHGGLRGAAASYASTNLFVSENRAATDELGRC